MAPYQDIWIVVDTFKCCIFPRAYDVARKCTAEGPWWVGSLKQHHLRERRHRLLAEPYISTKTAILVTNWRNRGTGWYRNARPGEKRSSCHVGEDSIQALSCRISVTIYLSAGLPANVSSKLFVSNCPKDITNQDIYSIFGRWQSKITGITWSYSGMCEDDILPGSTLCRAEASNASSEHQGCQWQKGFPCGICSSQVAARPHSRLPQPSQCM